MAYANEATLLNLKHTNPRVIVSGYGITPSVDARHIRTRADARKLLAAGKQAALLQRQGNKINRPWNIIDVTQRLDETQAWFGLEFELGFNNRDDYRRVINYMWQRQPFSAIDTEGFGQYSAELTFSPVNGEDFLNEKSGMWQLLRYMKKHSIRFPRWSHNIGTHVNVSTPSFRALNLEQQSVVTAAINNGLRNMPDSRKIDLFGRTPYGYGFLRHGGAKSWIEFKLFNSTNDINRFRGYKLVMKRIADLMEAISAQISTSPVPHEAYNAAARALGLPDMSSTHPTTGDGVQFVTGVLTGNLERFLGGDDVPVNLAPLGAMYINTYYSGGTDQRRRELAISTAAVSEYLANVQH